MLLCFIFFIFSWNRTPLDDAKQYNHKNVIKLLQGVLVLSEEDKPNPDNLYINLSSTNEMNKKSISFKDKKQHELKININNFYVL